MATLFILFLVTAQFQLPGKYYTFELISKNRYYFPGLTDGLIEGFGLVSSDVIALATILFLLRQVIRSTPWKTKAFQAIITWGSTAKTICGCWVIYFTISFFSSSVYSFSPTFSTVVVFQYLKMPIIFVVSLLLFARGVKFQRLFLYVVSALLVFQSIIGIQQMISSSATIGTISGTAIVAEENQLFPRFQGTFAYANQFALIQSLFLLLLLPYALTHNNWVFRFSSIAGFLSIIFSQSRISWVILFLAFVIYIPLYKQQLKKALAKIVHIHHGLLLIAIAIPVIVISERIIASTSFVGDYGGGPLRLSMIQDGLTLLRDAPFGGFGAETSVYQLFDKIPKGYIRYFPFAIHLGFLQMILESGIIGTIFFFLPFYLSIRQCFFNTKSRFLSNPLASSATLGLIGILMYYLLHPTYGRIEFIYIGLLLSISVVTNHVTNIIQLENE